MYAKLQKDESTYCYCLLQHKKILRLMQRPFLMLVLATDLDVKYNLMVAGNLALKSMPRSRTRRCVFSQSKDLSPQRSFTCG